MQLFDPTIKALNLALGAAGMRQQVLSSNLANVNTPGYKRSDVNFDGALAKALESAKAGDVSQLSQLAPSATVDNSSTMRADGNNVDIDSEMAYLAENNIRYNALVQLAAKKLQGLESVISEGKR